MIFAKTPARAILLIALVAGSMAVSAPVFAAENDALPQAALSLHGVDFTSPQAVAHLKGRLRRVATTMCFGDAGRQLMIYSAERACYETAVKDGLTQIDGRQQQAVLDQTGRDRSVRLADARNDVIQRR